VGLQRSDVPAVREDDLDALDVALGLDRLQTPFKRLDEQPLGEPLPCDGLRVQHEWRRRKP
jgi:hypothetical protein